MNTTKTRKALPGHLPRLLSILEVAEHLGLSSKTVRRHIAGGALPTVRLSRTIRITEFDLAAYVARGRGWCLPMSSNDQCFQQILRE